MSESTFQIVGSSVMLLIAAALVAVAHRQTMRAPLTRFAVVRACLIGLAAAYACWIASRIAQQFVVVLVVPALLAAVLGRCAILFERLGARALAVLCGVPGALAVGACALLLWGMAAGWDSP